MNIQVKNKINRGILLFIFLLCLSPINTDAQIEGKWEGEIEIIGYKIGFLVSFYKENNIYNGRMDIPLQKAYGLHLNSIKYSKKELSFRYDSLFSNMEFKGLVKKKMIEGTFIQSGYEGTFYLKPYKIKKEETAAHKSFIEEEVVFYNGNIRLAGTLSKPLEGEAFPVVIMITGSGPQDRNEDIFGFKIFKIISDHLVSSGIAVLRYDDRGVGGSTGSPDSSTTLDFATDVLAATEFLLKREDIDATKIGLFGHSEGGVVAPISANNSHDVAFVILMAGTAARGEEVLLDQQDLIYRAENVPEEDIAKSLEFSKRVFAAIRSGEGWDALENEYYNTVRKNFMELNNDQKQQINDTSLYFQIQVNAFLNTYKSSWFAFFLDYDPAPALQNLKVPVLALFGEKDLQVSTRLNKKKLEEAIISGDNSDYRILVYEDANHLFQKAKTGSPSEYPTLKKEFVPGFLDDISDWILARVKKTP